MWKYLLFQIVILFLFLTDIHAQEIVWEKTINIDSSKGLSFNGISVDNDVISVCGNYNDTQIMGFSKSFVMRFNIYGDFIWKYYFNVKYPLNSMSVITTKAKKTIFLGYCVLYLGGDTQSWFSPFKAIINSSGNIIFENYIDSSNATSKYLPIFHYSKILITKKNNLLMRGYVQKVQDTLAILELDSNINFINLHIIDTSANRMINYAREIIEINTGTKFLLGNEIDSSIYIIKLNAGFNKIQKKYFYYNGIIRRPISLAHYRNEKIIMLSHLSYMNANNLIGIYDTNLNVIKNIPFGKNNTEIYNGFVINNNGDIVCYGSIKENNEMFFRLVKFDIYLNEIWSMKWGKPNETNRNTILAADFDKNGNIYIAGYSGWKPYLAKIYDRTVSVAKKIFNNITISPNPATDYIDISGYISGEIKVYDVLGVCVLSQEDSRFRGNDRQVSDEGLIRIDVSGLAAGVYFVRVGEKVLKFVKL